MDSAAKLDLLSDVIIVQSVQSCDGSGGGWWLSVSCLGWHSCQLGVGEGVVYLTGHEWVSKP